MYVTANFTDPADLELAVTVKMTVQEWRKWADELRKTDLAQRWPTSRFLSDIGDVIYKVEKTFYTDGE